MKQLCWWRNCQCELCFIRCMKFSSDRQHMFLFCRCHFKSFMLICPLWCFAVAFAVSVSWSACSPILSSHKLSMFKVSNYILFWDFGIWHMYYVFVCPLIYCVMTIWMLREQWPFQQVPCGALGMRELYIRRNTEVHQMKFVDPSSCIYELHFAESTPSHLMLDRNIVWFSQVSEMQLC